MAGVGVGRQSDARLPLKVGRTWGRGVVLTLVTVIGGGGCTSPPSNGPEAWLSDPARTAVASQDGIRLVLAVRNDQPALYEAVVVRVEVSNQGPGAALYRGGGCGLVEHLRIAPRQPQKLTAGAEWSGDAALLKEAAVSPALSSFLDLGMPQTSPPTTCNSDLRIEELPAGETLRLDAAWDANDLNGAPVPAGSYELKATFPFIQRENQGPSLTPDRPFASHPIIAELPVRLPEAGIEITAVEAMDAILANEQFSSWLESAPAARWVDPLLRWSDGSWRFSLRVRDPAQTASVVVEGTSGTVHDFHVLP